MLLTVLSSVTYHGKGIVCIYICVYTYKRTHEMLVYVFWNAVCQAHGTVFRSDPCQILVSKKSMGRMEKSPREPGMIRSGRKLLLKQDRIVWPGEENTKVQPIFFKGRKTFCIPLRVHHQDFCFFSDVSQSTGDNYSAYKEFLCSQSVSLQCQA